MKIKYSEKTISYVYPSVIRTAIKELVTLALKIALERDLSDLKGLITLDTVTDLDIELLQEASDPMVWLITDIITLMGNELNAFKLIHHIDEESVSQGPTGEALGSDFFFAFVNPNEDVKQHYEEACKLMFMIMHLCYEFSILAEYKEYDLDGDEHFLRFLYLYYAADYQGTDGLVREMHLKSSHAVSIGRLLVDLEDYYDCACNLAAQ